MKGLNILNLQSEVAIPALDWLEDILDSLASAPHLEEISLEVGLKNIDWSIFNGIDEIFDGDAFPELKKVVVYVYYPTDLILYQDYLKEMAHALPILKERGVLRVK